MAILKNEARLGQLCHLNNMLLTHRMSEWLER
jgi:hypothetical protein